MPERIAMYQLRVYTLRDQQALASFETIWSNHINSGSLNKHGVTVYGVWTAPEAETPQLYALVSHPDDVPPAELAQVYGSSPEFKADVADFDLSQVVGVVATLLTPCSDSPMR
jgi:NIPSNAP protein